MPAKDKAKNEYKYKKGERKILSKRKKRFDKMLNKKNKLGIDSKCDRMDALFTPHLTPLDDAGSVQLQTSQDFLGDTLLMDKARKSMPLAFEKITTAQSLLIKENPRGVMKAFTERDRDNNFLIANVYYENFSQQKKKEVLKKYTYQLGKYGLAYWREYIKKTYRKQHFVDDKGEESVKWVYDVFDVVGENVHPKNVVLDDNCIGPKDVNRPANDLIIHEYLTKEEFEAKYPTDIFPNSEFVREGQQWMLGVDSNSSDRTNGDQPKIQICVYENVFENLRETWANTIPIESIPLPGDELSLNGDKWVADLDNYDGIGIGQVIEIYLPLVDDIVNCSLERLRQLVRPNEDWFNGVDLADESDDVVYGSGSVRKFTGDMNSIKYSNPPARSDSEAKEKEELLEEIDRSTMIPRNLAGTDKAKTAYQAAQNRESALLKMSLPLDSIKKTIEDSANLDIKLFQIAYSEPVETIELKSGDEDFDEALAIINQAKDYGIEDERAVVMEEKDGQPTVIARRKFRQMELPITLEKSAKEEGGDKITGRIIEADEKGFWEILPKHTNWRGRMEVIAESFLPVSKTLEDQQNKETIEYLMQVQTTDDMGRPTLTDATGKPYVIDKVRLVKERARMNKNFDPDRFVVPLSQDNQGQGNMPDNPLEKKSALSAGQKLNQKRPETANLKV